MLSYVCTAYVNGELNLTTVMDMLARKTCKLEGASIAEHHISLDEGAVEHINCNFVFVKCYVRISACNRNPGNWDIKELMFRSVTAFPI